MSGPLNTIFTAVNALLDPGITTHTGAEFIFAQESYPRVVWVPKSEAFGPPTPQGGTNGPTNPRPIWTRKSSVECHIWAADLDAAEALVQSVLQSLQTVLTQYSYEPTAAQWIASDGEAIKSGVVYLLTIEFRIPVCRLADTTATIVSMPMSQTLQVP